MPRAAAQGGEPQSFAIRGATVVPVSGPRIENGTVIVSHGVITAVGKDVTFPQETWIIDGKGLTVYPGLFDSFTDIGLVSAAASGGGGESGGRAPAPNFARSRRSPGLDAVARRCRRSDARRQAHRNVAQRRLYHRRFREQRRNFSRAGARCLISAVNATATWS